MFLRALALAIAVWLLAPGVALAHASFVQSNPPDLCGPLAMPRLQAGDPRCQNGVVLQEPPSAVRITFSEPVQLVGRGIRVLSPAGKPVQQGKPTAEGDQASVAVDTSQPGTYVVQWQVLSADTHPTVGQFAFSVGQPSSPASLAGSSVGQVAPLGLALQTLGRWLHFAGYALAFGVLGVGLLLARAGIEPPLALGRLTNAGIVLLLVAEPVSLLGQTASLGPDQTFDGDALGDALASPFGRLLGFRLAAALLLWVIGGARFSSRAPTDEDEYADEARRLAVNRRLALGAAIALGVALAAIDALGQHAASFRPAGLGLAVHALHLMAMALWLASVAVLAAARGTPLPGISRIVAGALALVAVTGLGMALAHIPQPSGVVDTPYGVTLAAKQLPLLAALLLGWLAFRRRHLSLWLGELGALGVVIGVAGLLVSLPPPR